MKKSGLSVTTAATSFLLIGVLSVLALGSSGEAPKAPAGSPAAGPFKPVAPLDVVMENVDDVFARMQKKLGTKDPKELKAVKKDAQFLSELFNIARYHRPEKDWGEWATKNRDQLISLAGSAEKGDSSALKSAGTAIDATCKACHEKYRDQ